MTFFVILVIALAWVGALWAWSRDRFLSSNSGGMGLPSLQPRVRAPGPLSPPRTAGTARRRRREVLTALALTAVTTFLLASAWSALWTLHLLVDLALLAYGWAVLSIERPDVVPVRPTLEPVLRDEPGDRPQPGPRREVVDSTLG